MKYTSIPSPNFDNRPDGVTPDTLVLHYTGMESAEAALKQLTNENAKVSAHYFVDEDGSITQLVADDKRAWHAGVSQWRGRERVNGFSIGIEIVNPGHEFGYRAFPDAQIQSVITLCVDLAEKYSITPANVVAHADIAPNRKEDPGELFPWELLAGNGVGAWHGLDIARLPQEILAKPGDENSYVTELQTHLSGLGYPLVINSVFDPITEQCLIAFKRHYVQVNTTPFYTGCEQKIFQVLQEKFEFDRN